uniref:Activin_recp domain-containing protein n=1 Tax=Strongyloides venezuelensis TaxID=75913 RepID=A0A0K0FB60_STRVS
MNRLVLLYTSMLVIFSEVFSIKCLQGLRKNNLKKVSNIDCGDGVKYCIVLFGYHTNDKILISDSTTKEDYFDCDYKHTCKKAGNKGYTKNGYQIIKICCDTNYCDGLFVG